jgi:hypothetical protein
MLGRLVAVFGVGTSLTANVVAVVLGVAAAPGQTGDEAVESQATLAGGAKVDLVWEAPQMCPDRDAVLASLRNLLGGREVDVQAQARIEANDGGYVLRMHTQSRDGDGSRTMRADDCAVLGEAAAIVLALTADTPRTIERVQRSLALDSEVPTDEDDPPPAAEEPSVPPAPEAEPMPPPQRLPGTTPPARLRHAPRFALRLAGAAGAGMLPKFNPGVALTLAVIGRNWRVESGWAHWFARRTATDETAQVRGDVQLSTGIVRAGWVWRRNRLEVPLLAGIDIGSLRVITGLRGGTRRRLWLAFTAGPAIAWEPHPSVALWAGVDAVIPYLRPQFVIENAGTLYAVPPFGVRGIAGLEVRLP